MCVVLTTAPDEEAATRIAETLVGEGLAACVNLVPGIRSIYRWRGAIERSGEVLLVVKTRTARMSELEHRLAEIHPYEVPEIVALRPERVAASYLGWVIEACGGTSG